VVVSGSLSLRRAFGFFLTLASALLLISVLPIVIPLGMLYPWLTVWLASIGILVGCLLMFELKTRASVELLLAGFSSLLLVNIVFLAPFPLELRLLLTSIFLFAVLLLSRYLSARPKGRRRP
jgi:hypothetical protein